MRRLAVVLALLGSLLAAAGNPPSKLTDSGPERKLPLTVYFFDVGQGDSALIVSPTGKTVLVDGGPPEAGGHVADRLKALVKGPIDLVILSHPHRDHLGGLADAVRAVGAKAYM